MLTNIRIRHLLLPPFQYVAFKHYYYEGCDHIKHAIITIYQKIPKPGKIKFVLNIYSFLNLYLIRVIYVHKAVNMILSSLLTCLLAYLLVCLFVLLNACLGPYYATLYGTTSRKQVRHARQVRYFILSATCPGQCNLNANYLRNSLAFLRA